MRLAQDAGMDKPPLDKLTDANLLALMHRVYRRSRQENAELVRILVAIRERRLHLKKAHPSLFAFCLKVLGMSNASAHRFSVAARLAAQFPDLIERIASGEIHLSTVVLMRHHLTQANAAELFELARGRTRFQVEELLASVAPREDVPSRMRKVPMPRSDQSVAAVSHPIQPLAPARYRVQFNADRETYDDIQHARDLMRHSNPSGDLERIFKFCVRAGVERLEARQRGLLRQRGPRPTDRRPAARTRHVPRAIRRAVFARDGAHCTFHDEDGNRCCSKTLLELDHIDLYAKGGLHTLENLRVRCRAHNRLHAEQTLGQSLIEKRIGERRASVANASKEGGALDADRSSSSNRVEALNGSNHASASKSSAGSGRSAAVEPRAAPFHSAAPSSAGTSTRARHLVRPLAKTKQPRVTGARGSSRSQRSSKRQ